MKTGPVGVILTTMSNAFETAEVIVEDYRQGTIIIIHVAGNLGKQYYSHFWQDRPQTVGIGRIYICQSECLAS